MAAPLFIFGPVALLLLVVAVFGTIGLVVVLSGKHRSVVLGIFGVLGLFFGCLFVVAAFYWFASVRSDAQLPAQLDAPDREFRAGPARSSDGMMKPMRAESGTAPQPPDVPVAAEIQTPIAAGSAEPPPAGPPRPAWADAPLGWTNGVYRAKVIVGPYATRLECDKELPGVLRQATADYIDGSLGEGAGRRVALPLEFIHEHIFQEEWEERVEASFGPMVQVHALVEFDGGVQKDIKRRHDEALLASRLGYTATGSGLVLGLLATLFGFLKVDTLTRGYYTGRLRLAAGGVILAEAVIVALLVLGRIGF